MEGDVPSVEAVDVINQYLVKRRFSKKAYR
jgi:hypothetical protein